MKNLITIGLPSKGRLKENSVRFFENAPTQKHIKESDKYLYKIDPPIHKLTIIGTGTMGQEHMYVTELLGRAEVYGIYDTQIESIECAKKKYGFIYTQAGMLALSEAIGTGNVGLLLDAWHWYTGLGTESDLRALTNEDVVYVHVNDAPVDVFIGDQVDNKRALPSETGVIDLVAFLRVLKEIGYDGPVTPEPFSQRVRDLPDDRAVAETQAGLQKAWDAAGID